VSATRPARSRLRRSSDIALWITVAYSLIVTGDVKPSGIPLKLYLLVITLGLWALSRAVVRSSTEPWTSGSQPVGPKPLLQHRSVRSRLSQLPSLAVPVSIVGLGVPIVWFAVAVIRHHSHDAAQAHVSYAVTEASHFLYVLLFFPLLDYCRAREGWLRDRIWLLPALVTCAITIGILLAWAMFGLNYGYHQLSFFPGIIGPTPAGYRVQLATQIMLLLAAAVALTGLGRDGFTRRHVALIVTVWVAATASQTRGYWLGLAIVSVVCVLIYLGWPRYRRIRAAIVLVGVCLIAVAQFFPSTLGSAIGGGLSVADRVQQAPLLLHAARQHLVLGSGLGAILPDGFIRSISNPWSFELTYYQLLFELGVVGLLAVLVLPATILWRTGRTLLGGAEVNQTACIALAATIGMLAADGTNPYLVDASGMTALALVAVMAELAPDKTVGAVAEREWTRDPEPATVADTGLADEGGVA
jgi:hypothetical protein